MSEEEKDVKIIEDFDGTGTTLRVSPSYDEKTAEKPTYEELDDGTGTLIYKGIKGEKIDTGPDDAKPVTTETVAADEKSAYDDMTKAELVEHAKLKGISEKDAKAKTKDELLTELKK